MFTHCPPIDLIVYPKISINGTRHYQTPKGEYPSITAVISKSEDSSWLQDWRDRIGEKEANRISATSSGRGTNLHTMCEDYLNNRPLSVKAYDAKEMFNSIKPILNRIDNIHFLEGCLYSDILKLAGTVDAIAEFDGVLSIIDFKNSRRIKTEDKIHNYFIQETFYSLAYFHLSGIKIPQIVTIIAVEDDEPQIFVKQIKPYIKPLLEKIKYFNLNF